MLHALRGLSSLLFGGHGASTELLPVKETEHEVPGRDGEPLRVFGGVHITEAGVIILPDGQLRALIRVHPTNPGALSPGEMNKLAEDLAGTVASLEAGQRVQILVESRPVAASALNALIVRGFLPRSEVTRAIAEDVVHHWGGQSGQRHLPDHRFYLVVSPVQARRPLGGERVKPTLRNLLRQLELATDEICTHLRQLELSFEVLGREAALQVLWGGLHHGREDRPPPSSSFEPSSLELAELLEANDARLMAQAIGDHLQRKLFDVVVRERPGYVGLGGPESGMAYAASTYMIAPPEITSPGFMEALVALECRFRLSYHLLGLTRAAERRRIKTRRRALAMIGRSTRAKGGVVDVDTEAAEGEYEELATETASPTMCVASLGLYLTVYAESEDELHTLWTSVRSLLVSRLNMQIAYARFEQLPLWQSTLPLGIDACKHGYRIVSQSVGDAFPFFSRNPGSAEGMVLGRAVQGGGLVLCDFADPDLPNGVGCITGSSGSGKSMLANQILANHLVSGRPATVIDRAGSYERLATAMEHDAQVVRLRDRGTPALNLWDYEVRGRTGEELSRYITAKVTFVLAAHEIMLARGEQRQLSPMQEAILEQGITEIYREHVPRGTMPRERELFDWFGRQLREDVSFVARSGGEEPRRRSSDRTMDEQERQVMTELLIGLAPYCYDGTLAYLVDRHTTVDLGRQLLVFDINDLGEQQQALCMFVVMEAVKRRAYADVARGAGGNGHNMLIVDEAWSLLKRGAAGLWVETAARESRHAGLIFIVITQAVSDLRDNPHARAVFNNASWHFVFRQRNAQSAGGEQSELGMLMEMLGLTLHEAALLPRLKTRKGQYAEVLMMRMSASLGQWLRGVVRVPGYRFLYWLLTTNADDKRTLSAHIDACDGNVVEGCRRAMNEREYLPPRAA